MRQLLIAVLVLVAGVCPSLGQTQAAPTADEVRALLAEAGVDPAQPAQPEESERVRALRAALRAAEAAEASRERMAEFRAKREQAPAQRAEIERELATPPETNPRPDVPEGATLAELEGRLAQVSADAQAARAELDALTAEPSRRSTRREQIPGEITAAQSEIGRLEEAVRGLESAEVSPLAEARRLRAAAELDAARARLAELRAEIESYDGRRELLVARRNQAERRASAAQALQQAWQRVVSDRRVCEAADAARQAKEADLAAAEEVDALAPIAGQVRKVVSELEGPRSVPRRLTAAEADLAETRELLRKRSELSRKLRADIARIGADPYGPRLQETLQGLKDIASHERQLRRYEKQIGSSEYRLQTLNELERESSDVGSALDDLMRAMGDDAERHRALATRLLEQRRTLVGQARESYARYNETVEDLAEVYTEYLALSKSLRVFVEEHVFSVRSVRGEDLVPRASDFAYDVAWLTDGEQWALSAHRAASRVIPTVPATWESASEARPAWHGLVLPIGAAGLLFAGYVARRRLVARSTSPLPREGRVSHTTMAGTMVRLAQSVLAALPLPAALWVLSAWLYNTADVLSVSDQVPTPAPLAVASGLARGAYVLLGLGLVRELVRSGGVGVAHFRWPEGGVAHLRRHFRWFAPVATVAAVVVQTFNDRTNDASAEVLGRLTLCAVLLVVVVFQYRVFSPRKPLVSEYIRRHPGGLIDRTQWAWYSVLVALPAFLAVATAGGYVYTALQVQRRVGDTFLFVVLLVVAQALVLRWLLLARRRIAVEAARARMAAAEGDEETKKAREVEAASAEVNLQAVSEQSRKVIRAVMVVVLVLGLYAVWSEVLPALRWFERLQVLPRIEYLEPAGPAPEIAVDGGGGAEAEPAAGGDAQAAQSSPSGGMGSPGGMLPMPDSGGGGGGGSDTAEALPITSVTVADIGLALLLLMLTVSASRNVPGLLEITLLPRLPIDAAARYAVFTVARYLVIIIGIVAMSRALEIPWRSAQWLAAAFTFGLAFGLQEIFANFVSGLIILFEQPIRVGDTVTVGSVNGTVAKIRMRATTIVDWDNKELVIPNKNFITNEVTNWTLSDPVTRVIIPVGIAYGSDTELARDLLMRAASESGHTLAEPESRALFLGFGDNSLHFELRIYIDTVKTQLVTVRSDLHFRIDRAFREAGIEISFPQRDLHVRSVDPKVFEGLRGGGEEPA